MGVGIIAAIAFDEERDSGLRALDARHLFAANMTRLAIRRGSYLRAYVFEFIRSFAPPLTRSLVEQAMTATPGSDFGL
jgi:LysR family cys regulon transcriptional activator